MDILRRYQAGEVIIQENDTGETAFFIEQGRVEVSKGLTGQKVHLAYIGTGEIFGEMSLIDDKPRSATVTAAEQTLVREIHRDALFEILQTNPDLSLNFLRILFERLREALTTITQLHKVGAPASAAPPSDVSVQVAASLHGLTLEAAEVLPANPFQVNTFPFRIGRETEDPLAFNDLAIPDQAPLNISRHHATLIEQGGRIGVEDRGSRLGSWVDDRQLGGPTGDPGPLFFSGSEGTLILGNERSPFRYKITID